MSAMDHARAPAFDFGALFSTFVIGVTAFLTVVDLFATQAILPALATHYGVAPAAMGVAVNATHVRHGGLWAWALRCSARASTAARASCGRCCC